VLTCEVLYILAIPVAGDSAFRNLTKAFQLSELSEVPQIISTV